MASSRAITLATLLALGGVAQAQTPQKPPYAMGVDPCHAVRKIEAMSFKPGVPSGDEHYDDLYRHKHILRDCLTQLVIDQTPMTDPRSEPTKVEGFVRGDLAFFLLVDFELAPFDDVLPEAVRARLPERGVFAYFDWIQQPGNRQVLRDNLRAWYAAHREAPASR